MWESCSACAAAFPVANSFLCDFWFCRFHLHSFVFVFCKIKKGFGRRTWFVDRNPLPLDFNMFVSQLVFWLPDHPVIHCLPTAIPIIFRSAAVTRLNVCESRSPVTAAGPRRIQTVFRLLETAHNLKREKNKSSGNSCKNIIFSPLIVFHSN